MKFKKKFYYNILKENNNELLLTNQRKFNVILKIQKNTKKQYSIHKNKLQIFKKKINDTIKNYHNDSLQEYFEVETYVK